MVAPALVQIMPSRKPNIDKKGTIYEITLSVLLKDMNYKGSAREVAEAVERRLKWTMVTPDIDENIKVEVIEYAGQFSWPQQWEELMAAQDWHNDRKELERLYNFCDAAGLTPEMPRFIMSPENWNDEYALMQDHPDWPEYDEDQMAEIEAKILQ